MRETENGEMSCISEQIMQWGIEHIPIQQKKRNIVGLIIVFSHYAIDYIILWLLISLSFVSTSNFLPSVWPFFMVRIISALLFIFFHHPVFILIDKLSIVAELILVNNFIIFGECLVMLIELIMSAVWALTKEQRVIHFDSRLGLSAAFIKQAVIYLIVVINVGLVGNNNNIDRQFCLLSGLLVLCLIDYCDQFYIKKTKSMFLRLDVVLLILILMAVTNSSINITYFQFMGCSFIFISAAVIHLEFWPYQIPKILIVPTEDVESLRQAQLWEYLVEIKRRLIKKEGEPIQTLLFKLKEEAEDEDLLEKIKFCQDKDLGVKREVVSSYLFDILRRTVKQTPNLRDLAFFIYTPSPRHASFFDKTNWHHRREYHRVVTQQVTDRALQQSQSQNQLKAVRTILSSFSSQADGFYQQLMRERISEDKVMEVGLSLISLLHKLKEIASAQKTNYEVGQLVNRFCQLCLPIRYQNMLRKYADDQSESFDKSDVGQILVGGDDTQLTVLTVNMNFIRLTYGRDKYRGKHLIQLLPQPFVDYLTFTLKNQLANDSKEKEPINIYAFNKLDYLSIYNMQIQPATHNSSRAWRLLLRQQYSNKSILVIDAVGRFIGCSELCRHYGFIPALEGSVLLGEYMNQLHSYTTICLYVDNHPFAQNNFSPEKDIVLINLDSLRLPISGIELYVLEVKLSDHHLRSITPAVAQEPVDFQFFFHWEGKISTKESPLQIDIANAINSDRSRQAINYGDNITEMRYFMGKIDYKSNFEEEQNCPSLQQHLEQALSSLTPHQYYQRWDHKKQMTPAWFRGACILTILLALIAASASIFIFMQFMSTSSASSGNLTLICLLQEKLLSVIRLATLTTAPSLSLNATSLINNEIANTNLISNSIFLLNQNIFGQFNGQNILAMLNSLNLMMNSYLLNPNYNSTNILLLITTQLQPNFHSFLNSYIASMNSNNNSYKSVSFSVLIVASVILIVLIAILAILEWVVQTKKSEIVDILKFIDQEHLQIYRNRLNNFKETWLQNGEAQTPEQDDEDVQDNKKSSPPKHLIKKFSLSCSKIYYMAWFVIVIFILAALYCNINSFTNMTSNFVDFNSHLAKQISHLQTVWTQYNNPSPNFTTINSNIVNSFNEQYLKTVQLSQLSKYGQISSDFINTYTNFWENNYYCNSISLPDCLTFQGGISHEGASMIISYVNRGYDSYLTNNFTNTSLYTLSDAQNAGIVNLFYLTQFVKTNNLAMNNEYSNSSKDYTSNMTLILIGSLIISLLILGLLVHYRAERIRLLNLQELLMVIPFDRLKNIPSFHRFYLNNYSSY